MTKVNNIECENVQVGN